MKTQFCDACGREGKALLTDVLTDDAGTLHTIFSAGELCVPCRKSLLNAIRKWMTVMRLAARIGAKASMAYRVTPIIKPAKTRA